MNRSTSGRSPLFRSVLAIGPLFVFIFIAFNIPIILMWSWSISNPTPTLAHYAYILEAPIYLRVVGNTARIAVITTVVCAVLGYPLAYWIRQLTPRWRRVALVLVLLPFWISILIRTYAWIVLLGNAGLVNRLLLEFGMIGAPIRILYSELGVVIGTVNVLLPFFVLPVYAAILRIDERLIIAAKTLGASDRTAFWRVFFPLTVPAVASGAILVFILTLGFFITPAILGGGRVPMAANMLDMLINQLPRWELASAISTLIMLCALILYSVSRWLGRRHAR